jgi:hypothetical protein
MITCQSDPGLNEPAAPIDTTSVPSMVQITGVPSSFCHRMSGLAVAVEVAGALDLPARPRIERADGADGGAGGAVAAILGAMPAMSVRPWQLTDLNRPAGFEQRIPGQHGFRVIETVGTHTDVPGKVSRH